ncbi:hypothetical protein [Hyalangium rubrum]|uniref:Secreted protein n=1 Tax=Hyalangium rubrum TaxID=3103134 RepID=A0ABU5HHR0_9BACT|nr:hypothetical protein [Hyalangium sp. s54d21]MDY7233001.1 hypothetical protein [Hyalangium sp. s54d21]
MMRHAIAGVVLCVAGALLLPTPAHAQPVLLPRCAADSLSVSQAIQRVEVARWCALTRNVGYPNWSCDGDYYETDFNTNPWGKNVYFSSSYQGVNSTYLFTQYLSGATGSFIDADGYCKWSRPESRRKTRPLYPIYGSQYDLASPTNKQLFLHPTQFSCTLYLDKNGTQPATGYDFYVNGYCEASP